jgi:methionyl-tRNA formyltransferase
LDLFSKQSVLLFSTSSASDASGDCTHAKKRVVFLGTPEVAATSLQTIYRASQHPDSAFEIVGVVTQPAKRRKSKGQLEASPVGKLAEELYNPVLAPEKAKDVDFLDHLEHQVRPDLCITAAYGQYLPKRFLAAPPYGTVNIHPSLLPRWRGASPVQRSLEAGDNPVGVTVLFTVSQMDAGPIIAQTERMIDEDETATTVLPKLFEIGTNLLLEHLPAVLSGKISMDTATTQDGTKAVSAAMIHSSEGELKPWLESARTCHNRGRGFSMWPGTFMYFQIGGGENDSSADGAREPMKVKIVETRVVPDLVREPTNIVSLGPTKKSGLYVTCVDGSVLELLQVQPATRKAFRARDFQNGYPGETIRWVETPEDQKDDPEKYNSRKRSS